MKRVIFFGLGLALLATQANAGVVNGGGGKGLLCGGQLQVLDLYEAQLKGYPAPVSSGDFDTDFKKYLVKILRQLSPEMSPADLNDPSFPDRVLADVKAGMVDKVIDIPRGETLDFTHDATLPPLPSGCRFVQIAVNVVEFKNDQAEIKVYRDRNLWDQLSPLNQVALLIHEYTYWRARVMSQSLHQEINSDDTRVLIGKMFSGLETYEMFSPLWQNPQVISCVFIGNGPNGTYEYHQALAAAETENGVAGTGLYFYVLTDTPLSSRTRAFLPLVRPEQLMGGAHEAISTRIESPLLERSWGLELGISDSYLKFSLTLPNGSPNPHVAEGGCNISGPNGAGVRRP